MRLLGWVWAIHRSFTPRERLLYGAVVFSGLALAFLIFRSLVPADVLVVRQAPVPIVGQSATTVTYRLDYCQRVEVPSTVHREWRRLDRDTVLVTVFGSGYSLEPGCNEVDIIEPIPDYAPPGRYTLRLTFAYAVAAPVVAETSVFYLP